MLEAKLGSAAAAEEAMQRVLGSEEGAAAGAEALVAEGLITQEDLEVCLRVLHVCACVSYVLWWQNSCSPKRNWSSAAHPRRPGGAFAYCTGPQLPCCAALRSQFRQSWCLLVLVVSLTAAASTSSGWMYLAHLPLLTLLLLQCIASTLVLTGALALGMGAVTPEEREAFMQGQLPEENVQSDRESSTSMRCACIDVGRLALACSLRRLFFVCGLPAEPKAHVKFAGKYMVSCAS
eukprot:scaffold17571_cov23-Tisochrysis_lutea.AAC.1